MSLRRAPLKLAWAGPWNDRSSIASFGRDVTAALGQRGHSVEILRTETGEHLNTPPISTAFPVHTLLHEDVHAIRQRYDVVIANLGDHFGYHGALAGRLAGIGALAILHDAFMANFCHGWAHQHTDSEAALRAMVRAATPHAALAEDEPYWLPPETMMQRRPMVELFARQSRAAIVHATHYRARIEAACPGPVWQLPLSHYDLGFPPPRRTGDTLEIVSIGHVNANRRIGEVIKAIGASPRLQQECRYHIVGHIEPAMQREIEAEMATHGVTRVHFTGWVDDDGLRRQMADIDVVCCLRHPVLEGASGSVIAALLSARPVLVSDQGCYGELPDDVVLKCQPGAEAADITRHLESLLDNRTEMLERGQRGRAYALAVHTPEHYAEMLDTLLGAVHQDAPMQDTARQFGAILASFGVAPDDPAATRVAQLLADMTGAASNKSVVINCK